MTTEPLDNTDTSCIEQFKKFLGKETGGFYKVDGHYIIKSAQQRVFIITVSSTKQLAKPNASQIGESLIKAIKESKGRLVLRIWKGASRWWNLNANAKESCLDLASSEVSGYKLAREAFRLYYDLHKGEENHESISHNPRICIPQVLYFESNECEIIKSQRNPWAVFSFVKEINNISKYPSDKEPLIFCDEFIKNMVKIRKEFGFDEPHPRHGRVCVENSVEYAMKLLDTVVLPIQSIFFSFYLHESGESLSNSKETWGKEDNNFSRIRIETKNLCRNNVIRTEEPVQFSDMIHLYQEQVRAIRNAVAKNEILDSLGVVVYLEQCIEMLVAEGEIIKQNPMPPVLCHMDLQPQNLVWLSRGTKSPLTNIPMIASILDWEESCFADARFEMLLICRKVLANKEQADQLWNYYTERVEETTNFTVGDIEPWLRLESVHSLLTMVLQGMGLLQGGRNPWEGKSDLHQKINRELHRLKYDLGWEIENAGHKEDTS